MKDKNKDKVYREVLGEPTINKKELNKENELFLNTVDSEEQRKILFNKICRIEKTVYFIASIVVL